MAIRRKIKAFSTHFHNTPGYSAVEPSALRRNHQDVGVLIAPDNLRTFETRPLLARAGGKRRLRASDENAPLINLDFNDLELDDDDLVTEDDLGSEPVLEDELENSGNASDILSSRRRSRRLRAEADDEDDDDEVDLESEFDDDDDESLDDIDLESEFDDEEDEEDEEIESEFDDEDVDEDIEAEDEMDVVDVDDIDEDVEEDDISVASLNASVLVLHKDRVVAKMLKSEAESDVEELDSDEFAEVVSHTLATKGLRKGLRELGFEMATVNIGASKVVSNTVAKRTRAVTARLKANSRTQLKAMNYCLALAATGINKNFWKDVQNPLRSAVESTLLHAGVSNPKSVTAKLFAENGVQYARSLVAMAGKLSAMPAATRNTLAEALDMTSDEGVEEEEFDDDDIDTVEGETFDIDDDSSDFEDIDASTIEAALSKPASKYKGVLLTPKSNITAKAILASNEPLEF